MKIGKQSWIFEQKPVIASSATVGGPFEARGKLTKVVDRFYEDLYMNQPSYEQSHQQMIEDATTLAVKKNNMRFEDIDFFISGDLINQLTPTNFAARMLKIPYMGVFSACATTTESLALAALIVNSGSGDHVLAGSASHNAAAEKQFRFPTEYGAQKPPSSQWTVTGAGFGVISKSGKGPVISGATLGRVIDLNQSDPFNMGAAMAPAAADTIVNHLKDHQVSIDHYDLVVTGDLGMIGRDLLIDLLRNEQINVQEDKLIDAGLSIYGDDQNFFAGGSGSGCAAFYLYSKLVQDLKSKNYNRVLVVATGALLSPLSTAQKQSIPGIAHAVVIESEGN